MGLIPAPRVRLKELAGLCNRLAVSLDAGLDLRQIWRREVESEANRPALVRQCQTILHAVEQGETISEGIDRAGEFFPPLFRELVGIGDVTCDLPDIFRVLHEYYQNRWKTRRDFLSNLSGTLTQLAGAIVTMGLFLIFMSAFGGWPASYFWIYFGTVVGIVGGVTLVTRDFLRRAPWTQPIAQMAFKIPHLDKIVELLSLARLARSLQLTFNTGMDTFEALRFSLRSSMHPKITRKIGQIAEAVEAGESLYIAFLQTNVFRRDFLEMIHVGEISGSLVEVMGRIAVAYEDEASDYIRSFTKVLNFTIWLVFAIVLICLIFSLYSRYLGALQA